MNEFGQKIPIHHARYRQSPTTSEAAITGAAVTAAAAALKAHRGQQHHTREVLDDQLEPTGVQRNKSFKERALDGQQPGPEPKHSVDRLADDHPRMGFNAVPHPDDMLPAGEWQDDLDPNPSINGDEGFTVKKGYESYDDEQYPGDVTSTRHTPVPRDETRTAGMTSIMIPRSRPHLRRPAVWVSEKLLARLPSVLLRPWLLRSCTAASPARIMRKTGTEPRMIASVTLS